MRNIFMGFLITAAIFSLIPVSCSTSRFDSQLRIGIWASEKGLWDEAVFRWKKVLESNPNSVAAHNNLAVAYEKKGLWEEAIKEYELALKLDSGNSYVKSNYENCKENMNSSKKEKDEKK